MPPESEDLYGDAQPPAATSDAPQSKDGDDDGGSTSILPRSFFAGKDLKVGDKCDVTITAIHENDVEVEPCEGGEKDEDEEDPPKDYSDEAPPPAAGGDSGGDDGGMSSMME